jgi:hypothetical protein
VNFACYTFSLHGHLGYRIGNKISRFGIDAAWVQDLFQNGIHRWILPTPYFNTNRVPKCTLFARWVPKPFFTLFILTMIRSKLYLVLLIVYLCSACAGIYPCRKQFNVYKDPILVSNTEIPIRTNGLYVSTNLSGSFFLFDNGYTKTVSSIGPNGMSFWENPESEIHDLQLILNSFEREVWGQYKICNDTIVIQTFGLNDQMCRRSVYETRGVILNDSIIKVFSDYSYWFDYELIEEYNIYRLYKTEQKPDTSKAWFNNKWWYKRNLHESRR